MRPDGTAGLISDKITAMILPSLAARWTYPAAELSEISIAGREVSCA